MTSLDYLLHFYVKLFSPFLHSIILAVGTVVDFSFQ